MPRLDAEGQQVNDGDSRSWNAWVAVGVFAGWILLGRVGPLFEVAPGIRAWYPPSALLAAAVVLWGGRALVPVILAASTVAVLSPPGAEPLWRLLLVSALLKVIYWVGARVLKRADFDCNFSSASDVALFAAVFGTAAAIAAIAAILDFPGGSTARNHVTLRLLQVFWLGDVVAVFSMTPAMIVGVRWFYQRKTKSETIRPIVWRRRDAVQAVAILAAISVATALAPLIGFLAYTLCFLPLGWIALVHGPRVAAFANVFLVLGSLLSVSQWTTISPSRFEVQAFTSVLALTGLLIGSVVDERERAFALLGESEERYRGLVEVLPDPLVVHDGGRIMFANGAAASVFGAGSADALRDRDLVELATPSSRELFRERMKTLGQGSTLPLVRHTVNRIDTGAPVEVETVTVPVLYQGKRAHLTVARDVTARVRLEEDLRQAQRMEAVGRLAGGVAHDFNNLLTVITSYSELILASYPADAELTDDVREIHHASSRATALTRQLLSFSRRQVLQPTPLEVGEVVTGIGGLLRRLISSEVEIAVDLDTSAGAVLADRGQLEQVIVNLAVNARDAMPMGGRLTITTQSIRAIDEPATARCATAAERFVEIRVADTGVGIEESTLSHIFEPFFTSKEVGRGTGLGLATVHGIVEQSGGTILVDSVLGRGTTFRILLPVLASVVAIAEPVATAPAQAQAGRGRVLLVEDDGAVRSIIRRTLDRAGYDIVEAGDGLEAIDQLDVAGAHFDLVLSDVAMPRMDGRQLASQLRVRWPTLPLLMMSGFADPDLLGPEGENTPLLLKPFTTQMLVAAVEAALGRLA